MEGQQKPTDNHLIFSALLLFFFVSVSILTAGRLLSGKNDFDFGADGIARHCQMGADVFINVAEVHSFIGMQRRIFERNVQDTETFITIEPACMEGGRQWHT